MKKIAAYRKKSTDDPREQSLLRTLKKSLTEDSKKTLSLRNPKRTLSLKNLKRNISL